VYYLISLVEIHFVSQIAAHHWLFSVQKLHRGHIGVF